MVSVIRRMRMFRGRLAHLRASPGAYQLPENVRKLSLEFAKIKAEGHWGPRKFWRQYLPGLKFYNPWLEVEVKREHEIGGPCVMTVEFADANKKTLNMQNKESPQIADELFRLVKAKPIDVSPEDRNAGEQWVKDKELEEKRYEDMMARRRKRAEERRLEKAEKEQMAAI